MCYDGPSALAAAEQFQPDACLLDLLMPGMDGYELAKWLREQQGERPMLLAAVTAYSGADIVWQSRSAGFDLYLVKPLDPDDVAAVLARTVGGSAIRSEPDSSRSHTGETDPAATFADRVVTVEQDHSGAWRVVLRTPDGEPVYLGPYSNLSMAEERAVSIRGFVAAVIRSTVTTAQPVHPGRH